MAVQIIGQQLDLVFSELSIAATKLYDNNYQVWELPTEEVSKLFIIEEDDWKEEYGWWRNGGTNSEGSMTMTFTVNNQPMIGFVNIYSWFHFEEETEDPKLVIPPYKSFSEWFHEYMDLGKETNLALFAHSLAELNNMTKAEFFQKFEG